jgi:O-antigen/teichoic acid export membrane protein
VKHSVRSTLATLGIGVLVQRLLQLATFLCIGQALGVERLGRYAEGQALGALLAVLAGAGVRNVLARAIARQPDAAGTLLRTAVAARFRTGTALLAPALAIAFAVADEPWFYALCLLQVLPAAFDLKNLLDATGRTGREVAIETGTAALQFALVGAWLAAGGRDLLPLAAIALGCRSLYAAFAVPAIARLPRDPAIAPTTALRGSLPVSLGQTAHELLAAGDVWLVARLFDPETAGLYALAGRLATAALVPSGQLARLLLPHLLRATAAGDPQRTARTALRATAFATLPMVGGGLVVAEPLCALFGPGFAAAAPALRLVLLAGCLQHLGWQCSHALFAAGRDRAYAAGLWWPAVLHALLLGAFAAQPDAGSAALAMLLAQAAYLGNGLFGLRTTFASAPGQLWLRPLFVGAATAAAAAVPLALLDTKLALGAALTTGGLGFLLSLWCVELRGRVRGLGDGLASASGFHH